MKRKRTTSAQKSIKKPTLAKQASFSNKKINSARLAGFEPELKYNTITAVGDATTTGVIESLNSFAAGDTALLRDGNKIKMVAVEGRVLFTNEALSPNTAIRYLIVYDKQSNTGQPSIATANTGPLDAITVTAVRQVATMSRFTILKDKVITLNNTSDTAGAFQKYFEKFYINLPEDCQFAQFADGTADDPQTGGLFLMYFSDQAAGTADVDASWQVRLRFIG